MISPHSAAYVSEMRKVSSESDSIVGFGEEGNATRHYTEVRFQLRYKSWKFIGKTGCLSLISMKKSDYDQFWEFAQNRLLTKAVIIFIWNDESALFSSKLKLKIENVIENGSFIGQYTKDNSQRNRFVNISRTTITYLVPSLHWEFIMGTINLNVKRAPYMSSLFYLEPWLLDSNPNSIQ